MHKTSWTVLGIAALALGLLGYRLLGGSALPNSMPPYSGARTDPRGASVLYGSLRRAGLAVATGTSADSLAAESPEQSVAFVLAPDGWEEPVVQALQRFAAQGGTVVLAEPPPSAAPATGAAAAAAALAPPVRGLGERLGAQVRRDPQPAPDQVQYAAPTAAAPPGAHALPLADPPAHLVLSRVWTPLYQRGGKTYMAVRAVGQGRMVIATEATFLSNATLAQAPDPVLLSWLLGARRAVWEDETLHGWETARGVPWLLARYHLQTATLLLLLALAAFLAAAWSTIERPPDAAPAAVAVTAENAQTGYVRLLERAIPPRELLAACWRQFAARQPELAARASQAEAELTNAPDANPQTLIRRFRLAQEVVKANAAGWRHPHA